MNQDSIPPPRALIIFGETEIKCFGFLRAGFRHCFAIIEGQSGWAIYNPLSHYTEIKLYPTLQAGDITKFYDGLGYTVVETRVREPKKKLAPIAPFTCVEAVKRVVGIQTWRVATPWQLYRYIKKYNLCEKNN